MVKGTYDLEEQPTQITEWIKDEAPTKQETNQTTLIVLVLVVIASLILWGLDSLLGALFGLIIG